MGLRFLGHAAAVTLALMLVQARPAMGQTVGTVLLRGHPQTLHLYGQPGQKSVVVSSGDGGWLHLAPQVAAFLASRGYFVVGFDSKACRSERAETPLVDRRGRSSLQRSSG
jgi:hypothetical protein